MIHAYVWLKLRNPYMTQVYGKVEIQWHLWQNNGHPRCPCLNPQNLWICCLHGGKNVLLMWSRLRMLRWEDTRWIQSNHTSLKKGRKRQERGPQRYDIRRTSFATVDFEDGGKGATSQWIQMSYRRREYSSADSLKGNWDLRPMESMNWICQQPE